MKLSTAFKITGLCFAALIVEAMLSYLIYSNYAFTLAETGDYNAAEAYSSGPMARVNRTFYALFGVTIAVGVAAPVFSLISMIFRRRPKHW